MLHILLGIVNRVYDELVKKIPEAAANWSSQLYLQRDRYHGNIFEGNECKKLLDNVPKLVDILTLSGRISEGSSLVEVFSSFAQVNSIVHDESVNTVALEASIARFKTAWKTSGMPLTTKVHIVISHLVDFVSMMNNSSIRLYSEQSHEAVHVEFWKTWMKYQIKDETSPNFSRQLLRAVLDYNGSHAP